MSPIRRGMMGIAALAFAGCPTLPLGAQPSAPQQNARIVTRSDITVVSGSVLRVGNETFRIRGLRTPRPSRGRCLFERIRGREARKALRRLLSRGEIAIIPTGLLTPRGEKLARVTVDGKSVRARLIERDAAHPRAGYEKGNPWCVNLG